MLMLILFFFLATLYQVTNCTVYVFFVPSSSSLLVSYPFFFLPCPAPALPVLAHSGSALKALLMFPVLASSLARPLDPYYLSKSLLVHCSYLLSFWISCPARQRTL